MKPPPEPNDGLVASEFLQKLRPGGPWVLIAIVPDGKPTPITAHTTDEVEAFVRAHDGKANLYYSVNPTRTAMRKKAAKTDIAAIEYVLSDLDPADGETPEAAKARYLEQLNGTFEPKPTAAIDSGNGIQGLWRLKERIALGTPVNGKFSSEDQAKIDDVEARAAAVMRRLGSKAGTQNIDRILRLPGTTNLPNAKKRKEGRTECPTRLLWFDDASYPLDAFPKEQPRNDPFGDFGDFGGDQSGSGYGFRFMQDCHARGMNYEQACAAILADKNQAGEWANRVDERQLQRAWERSGPSTGAYEVAGPQPLMRPLAPPEPFPLKALGPELASAAQAICDIVQSPIEMCAGAVLASTSFAVSAHANIKLPTGQTKPVSCWFWCIAESGERKTATDDQAFAPQKQHEQHLHARHEVELKDYEVRHKMWEAQSKAIEKDFKKSGAAGSEAHQIALEKLGLAPDKPLLPLLMASDFTFEGLVHCLNLGQPLYGIIGSEGGQFIGGHGMTDESKLRTITGLSAAWDGEPIKRVRATETAILRGRRVGMHLMIQPEVAATALGDELLTKQGFMSRVLACAPESLIGTRMHKDFPPEAAQVLQQYNERMLNIMGAQYPLVPGKRNELEPRTVSFSAEAEKLFWEFADEVEKAVAPGGEYESIRPFAAKLPEHAARLAAAIAGYRDLLIASLDHDDLACGMRIAVFYATEAKRISGSSWADPRLLLAKKLLDWLLTGWDKPTVTARDIYRLGPNAIRDRKTALNLARILVEHGWLIPIETRRADMHEWRIVRGSEP
jgi:hypothetical protein